MNAFRYPVLPLRLKNQPFQPDASAVPHLSDIKYDSPGILSSSLLSASIHTKSVVLSPRPKVLDSMQRPAATISDASHDSPSRPAEVQRFDTRIDGEASMCYHQPGYRGRSHSSEMEVLVGKVSDPRLSSISIGGTSKQDDFDYSGYKGRGRYAQIASG